MFTASELNTHIRLLALGHLFYATLGYMLATMHKETTFSFKATKEEAGKGAGQPYGNTKSITDTLGCRGSKNVKYNNVYYGRGYVQLTWEKNYSAIGKAYGIGDELHINPDRALEKDIAYFAASHGMRHGTFTNGRHKLGDHIKGKNCGYKNARQIINGHDNDAQIAGYARKIEILLRLAAR